MSCLEEDFPVGGVIEAGDAVEDARLARAVGAEEAVDLALVDREADTVERRDPAEVQGDILQFEDRRRGRRRGGCHCRHRYPS
jgi:hypothetical protein